MEQLRGIGNLIRPHRSHRQLVYNLVDALEWVGDATWIGRQGTEPGANVLDELRKTCDTVLALAHCSLSLELTAPGAFLTSDEGLLTEQARHPKGERGTCKLLLAVLVRVDIRGHIEQDLISAATAHQRHVKERLKDMAHPSLKPSSLLSNNVFRARSPDSPTTAC